MKSYINYEYNNFAWQERYGPTDLDNNWFSEDLSSSDMIQGAINTICEKHDHDMANDPQICLRYS